MAVPRDHDFWLVAFFLSRYGVRNPGDETALPPEQLGTNSWKEAYSFFYASIGHGRDPQTLRRSLKNARDTFDAHLTRSGRVGWRQPGEAREPQRLGAIASAVMSEWLPRSQADLFERVWNLVRSKNAKSSSELIAVRAARLGVPKPPKGTRGGGGRGTGFRRSRRANLVGRKAEEYVYEHLRKTLGQFATSLRHHAAIGETPGYDISYKDAMGQRQAVEVKGTMSTKFTSFALTENERAAAQKLGSQYTIWLVTGVEDNPRFHIITNPGKEWARGNLTLKPSEWEVRGFGIFDTEN